MVMVLAARRCGLPQRRTELQAVWGEDVMSNQERHARRMLEVTVMFEPTRLAADHLADASAQVVPPRQVQCSKVSDLGRKPSEASKLRRTRS
jgi:hypothetical protein